MSSSNLMTVFAGMNQQQLNALLSDPNSASVLAAVLPSLLHAAGAAAAATPAILPPVIVSGAPLTAPPSIDNCGGAEDSAVDSRRDAGRGGDQSAARAAAPSQPVQQKDSDEIVIIEERTTNVGRSSPVSLRPPSFASSLRSESPAVVVAPTVPPRSPAYPGAGRGLPLTQAQQTMLLGVPGLDIPQLVSLTAGAPINFKDFHLPATPESPQNTSFSTATSSGVSSGASTTSSAAKSIAAKMQTLKDALASNGEMLPKQEPLSREGSEAGGLDLNGRPPVPLCAICAADSTGIHFGVEACAACSAFFRRTVVLSKNYQCAKGGGCAVLKDQPGQRCRACRFTKCLAVGMDRNAVQHRRDAIGKVSQIKKEGSPFDDEGTMVSASYHNQISPSTSAPQPRLILDEWIWRHLKLSRSRKLYYSQSNLADSFDYSTSKLYTAPTEMENFSECIFQLWRVEPKLVAEYVNNNSFTRLLPPHEKAALFRNFFLSFQAVEEPYLTWTYDGLKKSRWVMPNRMYFCYKNVNEYFATNIMHGLNLDMATAVRIFMPSFYHAVDMVAAPMSALGITHNEMVALSGIIYLDPTAPDISQETRELVKSAREDLMAGLLKYYQDVLYSNPEHPMPDCPEVRLFQLVQISAGIRIHAEKTRENMQILSLFDVIPCDPVFNEICNIESAYTEENRNKLRGRVIKEELLDMDKVVTSDKKWKVLNDQKAAGILASDAKLSDVQGYKTEYMSAPILERDSKIHTKLQLTMLQNNAKKEEPDRGFSPDSTVAPGALLAAAAVSSISPPAAAAAVRVQPALSLASFIPPPQQSVVVSSAAAAAATPLTGSKRTFANMAVDGFRATLQNDAAINRILNGQERADELHRRLEANRAGRPIYPSQQISEQVNISRMMQAVDTNMGMELDRKNAATVADATAAIALTQQDVAGPSSEKRVRLSLADSGTNPTAQPSNSDLMAALMRHQQMQQLQQPQPPIDLVKHIASLTSAPMFNPQQQLQMQQLQQLQMQQAQQQAAQLQQQAQQAHQLQQQAHQAQQALQQAQLQHLIGMIQQNPNASLAMPPPPQNQQPY